MMEAINVLIQEKLHIIPSLQSSPVNDMRCPFRSFPAAAAAVYTLTQSALFAAQKAEAVTKLRLVVDVVTYARTHISRVGCRCTTAGTNLRVLPLATTHQSHPSASLLICIN